MPREWVLWASVVLLTGGFSDFGRCSVLFSLLTRFFKHSHVRDSLPSCVGATAVRTCCIALQRVGQSGSAHSFGMRTLYVSRSISPHPRFRTDPPPQMLQTANKPHAKKTKNYANNPQKCATIHSKVNNVQFLRF